MGWWVGGMMGEGVCWRKCGWKCVGAGGETKSGIASAGCMMGVWRV